MLAPFLCIANAVKVNCVAPHTEAEPFFDSTELASSGAGHSMQPWITEPGNKEVDSMTEAELAQCNAQEEAYAAFVQEPLHVWSVQRMVSAIAMHSTA